MNHESFPATLIEILQNYTKPSTCTLIFYQQCINNIGSTDFENYCPNQFYKITETVSLEDNELVVLQLLASELQ